MKKKVFITGASSGIGEYLAYAYAEKEYIVGLAARREDRLASVLSKCKTLGGDGKSYPLDVLEAEALKAAIDDFISLPGDVDTIYANAGVGGSDKLSSGDSKAMNRVLKVNILGVTNTVLPFIPYLKSQNKGKIAVVSSVASFRGLAYHSAYSGSKAAVRNFCQGWDGALHKYNISVSAICPGFITSEMTDEVDVHQPFKLDTDVAVKKIIRAVERRKKVFIFPWQMRFLMVPVMKHAPDWIIRKFNM
ncbi:MAG: SDR family NAD(P)-dependent oxidoreductase [Candidatus Marinimicrobia bacterium]|jgi:short-subunit dehydrogenase|nr:SDR family NAD(P)-dependent oxidoreductase [Candidatus Neomarinimicrobiota bacterium]MDP6612154.1 SDR family NAD(P)-dependent oxidoreductase [Candidatus Neomarinimicrobiota bacterium]|tara:strand:+ start:22599 stop:23342 length:744 start_codon:yes stop_codon:yes gene_type:complete